MQLVVSAGLILAIVLWGVIAPASLGGVFDTALAGITRNFGWFYQWVVLGLRRRVGRAAQQFRGERV